MKKRLEIGDVFGRLTAIKPLEEKPFWEFKCSCGKTKKIRSYDVLNGRVKSCSCLLREKTKDRMKTLLVTHGMRNHRLYSIWRSMKKRCENTNAVYFKNYGGRGIRICKRWKDSFENFCNDMLDAYNIHVLKYGEIETTLDRIDVNGNYNKKNCKFSTRKEQDRNKRNTIFIIAENIKTKKVLRNIKLTDFCEMFKLNKAGVYYSIENSTFYKKEWILTKIKRIQ